MTLLALNPLVSPDPGLFIWSTVAFLILFFLLSKFAWKPIVKALDERERSIEDALTKAEMAKAEMAKLISENEDLLKEARLERDNILKEAKEIKDQMINDAKDHFMHFTGKQTIKNAGLFIEADDRILENGL